MKNFNCKTFDVENFEELISAIEQECAKDLEFPSVFVHNNSLHVMYDEERNHSEYVIDFTGTDEYILKLHTRIEDGKLKAGNLSVI